MGKTGLNNGQKFVFYFLKKMPLYPHNAQFSHSHLALSGGQLQYETEQIKMQIILALLKDCREHRTLGSMPGQEGGVSSGSDIRPQRVALLPPWPLDNPSEIELSWRVTDYQP